MECVWRAQRRPVHRTDLRARPPHLSSKAFSRLPCLRPQLASRFLAGLQVLPTDASQLVAKGLLPRPDWDETAPSACRLGSGFLYGGKGDGEMYLRDAGGLHPWEVSFNQGGAGHGRKQDNPFPFSFSSIGLSKASSQADVSLGFWIKEHGGTLRGITSHSFLLPFFFFFNTLVSRVQHTLLPFLPPSHSPGIVPLILLHALCA